MKTSTPDPITDPQSYTIIGLNKEEPISFSDGYVLMRVIGNSMNQAHPVPINDGDYVLVHQQSVAEDNDIVVAHIFGEDNRATIKRLKRRHGKILLVPESNDPAFSTLDWKKEFDDFDIGFNILGIAKAVLKPKSNDSSIVSFQKELPSPIQVEDFLGVIIAETWIIEFTYSVFAILSSQDQSIIKELLNFLRSYQRNIISNRTSLNAMLAKINIEPLKLISMKYGSPVTFDLLGIGNILEQVRDTIKDVSWKNAHEKEIAVAELNKLKLETEKLSIEVTREKIELLEKTSQLKLPTSDKNLIISALTHEISQTKTSSYISLLQSAQEIKSGNNTKPKK